MDKKRERPAGYRFRLTGQLVVPVLFDGLLVHSLRPTWKSQSLDITSVILNWYRERLRNYSIISILGIKMNHIDVSM
jgi:hypothetical protein